MLLILYRHILCQSLAWERYGKDKCFTCCPQPPTVRPGRRDDGRFASRCETDLVARGIARRTVFEYQITIFVVFFEYRLIALSLVEFQNMCKYRKRPLVKLVSRSHFFKISLCVCVCVCVFMYV